MGPRVKPEGDNEGVAQPARIPRQMRVIGNATMELSI